MKPVGMRVKMFKTPEAVVPNSFKVETRLLVGSSTLQVESGVFTTTVQLDKRFNKRVIIGSNSMVNPPAEFVVVLDTTFPELPHFS